MAFSPQFLDELRTRSGLAQVIGRRVRLTRKGREHIGLCPFHKEKTPSFTVNEDKGFYHCFGCGAHGSVIDFVMNTEGMSFPEAVERLAAEAWREGSIIKLGNESVVACTDESTAKTVEKVEALQNLLISEATGGAVDNSDYQRLRRELLGPPELKGLIPKFVRTCRDSFQFWQFIKHKFGSYAERRTFIWNSFAPVFEELEAHEQLPSDTIASLALRKLDEAHVLGIWERALGRRISDPEGAITIARTLLETVCKHILGACPSNRIF